MSWCWWPGEMNDLRMNDLRFIRNPGLLRPGFKKNAPVMQARGASFQNHYISWVVGGLSYLRLRDFTVLRTRRLFA